MIAVKLRLVMPKTNKKDKIGDQKNLLVNFIFLKVVVLFCTKFINIFDLI